MHWSCTGTPEFELEETDAEHDRGTTIVLHLSEDSLEYAESSKVEELLRKYCRFLPVPIAFGKVKEWKDGKYVDTDKDNIINNIDPLWTRKPADITEEQYKEFYHELYPLSDEPLFSIHLNIDYPFHLTGILYFPKIRNNFEIQKNKIQHYIDKSCNNHCDLRCPAVSKCPQHRCKNIIGRYDRNPAKYDSEINQ